MKKVAVFNLREFDEAEWFEKYAGDLGLELSTCPDAPDMDNIVSVTEAVNAPISLPPRLPGS